MLVKGIACGGLAGLVYAWLAQKNRTLAAVAAAIVCPVVNTGVFLLGCRIFFLPMLADMAQNLGFGDNVGRFMIIGLVGVNFLAELGINIVLSPRHSAADPHREKGKTKAMILAIDTGNTNIVLGCIENRKIRAVARMATDVNKTDYEYAVGMKNVLAFAGFSAGEF